MIRRTVRPARRGPARRGGGCGGRLIIAVVLAIVAIGSYYFGTREEYNPITEQTQRVSLTVDEEIALGLQAAPQMAEQFGGLHPDPQAQALLENIGRRLVQQSGAGNTDYQFNFHLLADEETVNAFALPGGQIFITAGLLNLLETEGEVAGVLAHEIGHVVGRHSAEQIAQSQLIRGLSGAAAVAVYDPENPGSATASQMAMVVGEMVNMRYGREHELESDRLGVQFMADAGYDPRALLRVMEVLGAASQGQRAPEFMSTHPHPENRLEAIQHVIDERFPEGVPDGLQSYHLPFNWPDIGMLLLLAGFTRKHVKWL
jgi:beta-barrel assembly-enhancing protease